MTAAVVWGLLLSLRQVPRPRPAWMLDLHRFLGGLALVFVVLHVGALTFDSFVGFDGDDLLVPYASSWRPAAVAWGITAAYLLVAVELTSLLMRHVRRGLWHAVHLFSYVVFVRGHRARASRRGGRGRPARAGVRDHVERARRAPDRGPRGRGAVVGRHGVRAGGTPGAAPELVRVAAAQQRGRRG